MILIRLCSVQIRPAAGQALQAIGNCANTPPRPAPAPAGREADQYLPSAIRTHG